VQRLQNEENERKKLEEWKQLNQNADALFNEMMAKNNLKKCPHCIPHSRLKRLFNDQIY
jgi:hypothetical protein